MSPYSKNLFRCAVIAPGGKLLDCQTPSVIFPAHDGQVGVWHNHMPMICSLGLGIMEVKGVPSASDVVPHSTFLLIDSGVAMISYNLLTITASDAVYTHDMEAERVNEMLEKAKKKLAAGTYSPEHRRHEEKKLSLLAKLTQKSAIFMK
jgi:F-type H+-transporting ATPase subunit epsilon